VPKPEQPSGPNLSGEVTGGLIEPSAAERYVAESGASYEQPLAFPENPLPAYPSDLLSSRLPPVSVQVRVVVDNMGHVTSVVVTEQAEPTTLPFIESVRSAVQGWKFTQLVKVVPGPGSTSLFDAAGIESVYMGKATAMPFHQDYRFVFSQTEGKANVAVQSASTPES
jgi:hypothetical protein